MQKQTKFPYRFFVVTFIWSWLIWSWLIWLPLVMAGAGILPLKQEVLTMVSTPMSMLAAFGPGVGAFYALRTLNGKGAVRQYLRGLLDFKLGWQAWIIPALVLGGSSWLAWLMPELWGAPHLGMYLPSVWIFPVYLVVMVLLGGGQEELGWRGYILDPMEEKLGPWLGNLVLGVVWAVWHLPLFFIPGTSQTFMPFAGFMLLTIGYSWFFAWVRQVSGKKTLAGLVVHGWANAFISLFPTVVLVEQAAQTRYWIWVGLTFLIGMVTMFLRWKKSRMQIGFAEK